MSGAVDWQTLKYLPIVAAAGVACVVAIIALYRSQLTSAAWGWRWIVPGFRVLAVGVLLASVLRPSVRRPAGPDDLGDIVVAVGDAASMSVVDRSWSPAERVAITDALGGLPAGVVRWSGRGLRDQIERLWPLIDAAARAQSELDYARVAGRGVEQAARRAAQRRATLVTAARAVAALAPTAPESVRPSLRWDDVATVVDSRGVAAWAELRARVDAAVAAIDAQQAAADAALYESDERVRAACSGVIGRTRAELARQVVERILAPATVVRDAPRPGRPVRAVVLLGDGRGADGAPPAGARVVVARVAPAVVRDVAIREATVPAVAYVGDVVPVRVELRAEEFPGARLTVRATAGGATEVRETVVGADGAATMEIPLTFDRAGLVNVGVAVTRLDGEATEENNRLERRVRVLAARTPVLLVEGGLAASRSESVRNALARVSGVAVRAVSAGGEWPVGPDDRMVVLDDVAAGALSVEQLDAINELVVDRGGTLVLAAGRMNWPLDDESESLLEDYLPYTPGGMGQAWWRVAGGRPAMVRDPSAVGLQVAAVRRYVHFGEAKPGVRVLMSEQESGAPVVTEAAVGRGRVVTVAMDLVGDPAEVERFWAGLMRRLAERTFAAEREGFALDTDGADVAAGTPIRVRARLPEDAIGPAAPSVLVTEGERVIRTETMSRSVAGSHWEATVANLPAGEYKLWLDAQPAESRLELSVRVRAARERELADVTPDEGALRRLAGSTGGEVIGMTEVDRLPEVVLRHGDGGPAVIEYPLWDSPYLFLFVTACLTTEWALRKRLGLA